MEKLKKIWRWMVAIKDGLALVALLIFFVALFMFMSASPNPADSRGGALLVDLDGVVVEQAEETDPLALVTGGPVPSFAQIEGHGVVRALRLAAKDSDIDAVVLNLDGFMGGGQVLLLDIAKALKEVKAAKKKILAYATGYSDDAYLLAAHADEIWLNPMGGVVFAGPGGSNPYFKGLIDRFGVNVHVFRVGKYKSFVEPFTRANQSDEARAASQSLANAVWEEWQAKVKTARPQANIAPMLSDPASIAGREGLAESALKLRLVDRLADEADFGKRVAALVGADDDDKPADFNRSTLESYLAANPAAQGGDGVGVITIAGEIVDGFAGSGMAGGDSVSELVEQALEDDNVKALVVRIDSPGGSALASEQIRIALQQARAKKLPVIVSMGNVAASGGYWIAMAGDKVFAEPSTITGSIGVFGILPTFENSLARYGVTSDGVKTTPLSGQPDVVGGLSPETDRLMQAGVEDIYRRFTIMVSEKRKLPVARVEEIAQGRVWDGGAARQLGLVDGFGSLDEAVAEAAKRAGLDSVDVRRISFGQQQGVLSWALGGFVKTRASAPPHDVFGMLAARQQGQLFAGVRDAGRIMTASSIQARCMSCPSTTARLGHLPNSESIFSRIFQ